MNEDSASNKVVAVLHRALWSFSSAVSVMMSDSPRVIRTAKEKA
jgi:hypothetical protein